MVINTFHQVTPAFLGYYLACNPLEHKDRQLFLLFPKERDCLDFLALYSSFSPAKWAFFPSLENFPFSECVSRNPSQFQRLKVLWELPSLDLVVTTPQAFMRKMISREVLQSHHLYLIPGEVVERDKLIEDLVNFGYERVRQVEEKGTYSVKGSIIDLFSPQYEEPVRMEFFGDEVVSLRFFHPETQKSISPLEELLILPVREVFFTKDVKNIYDRILRYRDTIPPERLANLLNQVEHRIILENEDFLLPFFFSDLKPLPENLSKETVFFLYEPELLLEGASKFWEEVERFAQKAQARGKLIFEPSEVYLSWQDFVSLLEGATKVIARELPLAGELGKSFDLRKIEPPKEGDRVKQGFSLLKNFLDEGYRVYLFVSTEQTQEIVLSGLRARGISNLPNLNFRLGELSEGFLSPTLGIAVTSEYELFGKRTGITRKTGTRVRSRFRRFEELKPGDFVVHKVYGIGKYLGLSTLSVDGMQGDYLEVEYADGDRLYLPPARLDELYPYVGLTEKEPKLDKLGRQSFLKRRRMVEKSLAEVVQDILNIYAERRVMKGFSVSLPVLAYQEFTSTFPYTETPDQEAAIEEIIQDLTQEKPMERLVVGDVGFGKTEVAMRAAFIMAYQGKQVAMLVPTTILAEQHYRTFQERFQPFGLKVAVLSRLRSPAEIKGILRELAQGEIKVIIGTHRLLSSDVQFKDLGLLIIDEEHRFGVKQKERLKQLKKSTKVLILSATPIPRSLQLSLLGIYDLSVIETPPPGRRSISTYLARFDREIIRTAIERELERKGQIYFVHPRIKGLNSLAVFIKKHVPSASVEIIHGQMSEETLERNLCRFLNREVDVLVCTPIIGSGVDIPRANTIIINRADLFGLSDLYQLRGRVGRSDIPAYAYLLVPDVALLTEEARKRLQVILHHTELGSGFKLAMSDLKIRGAGELLGLNQSGHINTVGYELYLELLENTIKTLKGEKIQDWEPEVKLKVPAFIPAQYVPEPEERLSLYRELAVNREYESLLEFKRFLIDKYGPLPVETENLIKIYLMKSIMRKNDILQVEEKGGGLWITFKNQALWPRLKDLLRKMEGMKITKVAVQEGYTKIQVHSTKGAIEASMNLLELI